MCVLCGCVLPMLTVCSGWLYWFHLFLQGDAGELLLMMQWTSAAETASVFAAVKSQTQNQAIIIPTKYSSNISKWFPNGCHTDNIVGVYSLHWSASGNIWWLSIYICLCVLHLTQIKFVRHPGSFKILLTQFSDPQWSCHHSIVRLMSTHSGYFCEGERGAW